MPLIANRHSHVHHSLIGKTQTMYGGIIPAQQICRLPVLMLVNLISIIVLIQHNILNLFFQWRYNENNSIFNFSTFTVLRF